MIAHMGEVFTAVTGRFVKLTPFTIRMLIIHRYATHSDRCSSQVHLTQSPTEDSRTSWTGRRYFDISAAREDLGYSPIIGFEEGWKDVVAAQCAKRGVYSGGSWAIFEQKQKTS